jgi:GNAT superfamily N-acetyltransferase
MSSHHDEFRMEQMRVEDYEACLAIAIQSFTTRNPVIKHLKVTADELESIFRKDTKDSVKAGLCMTAKSNKNDEIVGFLFCHQCDFMLPEEDEKPPVGCNLRHSYDAGEALYLQAAWSYRTSIGLAQVARGETLRVVSGATAEGYEGKGVGTLLRCRLLEFARERGFRRVLVEAISPATIHIWGNKAGYELRAKMKLSEFVGANGIRHLEGIDPVDTEMAIFEGLVVDETTTTSFSDQVCRLFWLGVILCKYRRWFKPYEQQAISSTES